jgi:hypothetical protein
MIALFTLATMLAVAPAQTAPAPSATPNTADVIPEIGRVKSKAPACSALQDLVAPSFAAAMRADKQFAQAAPQFAAYATAKASATALPTNVTRVTSSGDRPMQSKIGADELDSPTPEMYLARLDKALAEMKREAAAINKALGDPRLASDSNDPAVQSERKQLSQLYDVQVARIATLQEFLDRQRLGRARTDTTITNNTAFDKGARGAIPGVNTADNQAAAAAALDSGHVVFLFGQPSINGQAANDKQSVNDWTTSIGRAVRENENTAAKTFFAIALNCQS